MNRQAVFEWVNQQYGTDPDYPWKDDNAVLRHKENKKWYAVVLQVSKDKLGIVGNEIVDVINVKCDPALIGSLRMKKGFFPAYHMNKNNWISILIDGTVPEKEIRNLIDLSYEMTGPRFWKEKIKKEQGADMGKKVLVITSSLRKGGNSDTLAEYFAKGAEEAGNEVEVLSLADKTVGFCKGCFACQKTQKCVINDDAVEIAEKMKNAEVIAFATPIYYYSVSGQLKTMLDRANPLFASEYAFRDIYLLAAAAEDENETISGTKTAVQGWIDCFERAKFVKTIFAGGVNDKGDIAGHKALKEAYQAGKEI